MNKNEIKMSVAGLLSSNSIQAASELSSDELKRISGLTLDLDTFDKVKDYCKYINVTGEFRNIIRLFGNEAMIPAGFRPEVIVEDACLKIDLKRDISYDKNGVKRPTRVLFSADSANPYEVAPVKAFLGNLTCNPAIIYDLFINNPKANIGNKFKDRYEVIQELSNVLGSGVDISVEVDDPFADRSAILEEIKKFEEILTPYKLVVKVPHTGATTKENIGRLVNGRFDKAYSDGSIDGRMYGHNLAYMLQEQGYRINFTLMFEPYQTALALQAKPYFINTFIKHRSVCSKQIDSLLKAYRATNDKNYVQKLHDFMLDNDYLPDAGNKHDLLDVITKAEDFLKYREFNDLGNDGLDSTRHSLRILKNSNLDDTRLIICSMDGNLYPQIDKMLMEPEFKDMLDRVVITAPPSYLTQFVCAPGILTYQRIFAKATNA